MAVDIARNPTYIIISRFLKDISVRDSFVFGYLDNVEDLDILLNELRTAGWWCYLCNQDARSIYTFLLSFVFSIYFQYHV